MAAYVSPNGFSYAQAARGVPKSAAHQSPSSTVTPGMATAGSGTFTELTTGGNWADHVEASQVEDTPNGSLQTDQEESETSTAKESAVERVKEEDEKPEDAVGAQSPEIPGSASSTTKEDDISSAQNGSPSDSTWDTKSQASEPAWIADRKERQNGVPSSEKPGKGDRKSKDATPPEPKPVVLQPAPAPPVNIWQQRAESQKAKMSAMPKPVQSPPAADPVALKENQRPKTAPRQKTNSITGTSRQPFLGTNDENSKSNNTKPVDSRSNSPLTSSGKATSTDRESEKAPLAPPPSVKDDMQWPTPDSAPDKERRPTAEREMESQRNEDGTPTTKRKKQEWTHLAVVPKYNQPDDIRGKLRGPPNGDRSARNANGFKGRGPARGASNPTTRIDREQESSRSNSTPHNTDAPSSAQDRSTATSDANTTSLPPVQARSSSAGPQGHQRKDTLPGRKLISQTPRDANQSESVAADGSKSSFSKPFPEARRTKSPKRMSPSGPKEVDEFVPRPIPRRSSIGTQTDEVAANTEGGGRDVLPTRPGQSEPRKELRNGDSVREPAYTRGGKRNGRGRGGNTGRDLTNGHPGPSTYGNAYGAEYQMSPYAALHSPGFPGSRGNHQLSFPPPRGNGNWRGNSRSHSIPLENFYNQNSRAQFNGSPNPMHGIQPFIPGMYDMNGYPMSAMPYPPEMATDELMRAVCGQVEFYFSVDNLIKDMFLRRHMDSQGFVFLDMIASFNRIKQLTQDNDLIKGACLNSQVIEIRIGEDGKERLRNRENWRQFCLPMEQREPGAQNEGPKQLRRPEGLQLSINGISSQFTGPASAGLPSMHQRFDRRSYDAGYPMANGYPPQLAAWNGYMGGMYPDAVNGDEPRGRSAKSPMHETPTSSTGQSFGTALLNTDSEPDTFPDDQVSVLTVVVKNLSEQRAPYHSAASRTFSNGSIDSRSIMSEIQKPSETNSQASTNGETLGNGSDSKPSLSRTLSPNKPHSLERVASNTEVNIFWVKEQDTPIGVLPPDPDLTSEPYLQLRQRALEDRGRAVTGNTPYDLEILYQFWCHFLLRNFNNSMYAEFKHFANEDARNRFAFDGLKNLVQFYSKSLGSHSPIRDRVVKDYVELVKTEPPKMEGAAFKTLRSAWRNGALNLKNRKKVADILDEDMKEQLDKGDA